MRSPTKLKENKSLTASIEAIVKHNAHEYFHKHYRETIPVLNQKQGYRAEQWVRYYKNGKLSRPTRRSG